MISVAGSSYTIPVKIHSQAFHALLVREMDSDVHSCQLFVSRQLYYGIFEIGRYYGIEVVNKCLCTFRLEVSRSHNLGITLPSIPLRCRFSDAPVPGDAARFVSITVATVNLWLMMDGQL